MKTNLERLNELLRDQDLPQFRKTVSPSLNNLKWLKATLLPRDTIPDELRQLLTMDQKTLTHTHVPEETQRAA